jgi:hypothetical protein
VEELPDLSDEEAVEKSRQMFNERKDEHRYDGFEVWDLSRMLIQYTPVEGDGDHRFASTSPNARQVGAVGNPTAPFD